MRGPRARPLGVIFDAVDRKLLILDLDETLIHATEECPDTYDFEVGGHFVSKRPGLEEFLAFCLDRFSVGIWSQASTGYVAKIVNCIVASPNDLQFIWGNERCTFVANPAMRQYYWVKDLRKIRRRGYRLSDVIVVDDSPRKLERSYGNLVRIRAFHGDEQDNELRMLMGYLDVLATVTNIRSIEKRYWREELEGGVKDEV